MTLNTVFLVSFITAAPFWGMMIFLPEWKWTRRIIRSPLIFLPSALLYAVFALPNVIEAYRVLGSLSLTSTAALFGTELFTLIIWLHFITVDLVAGRWAYLDGQEHDIPTIPMGICLLLIVMFAPLGILIYLGLRTIVSRTR